MNASGIIKDWPEKSREPAQVVIDTYGEPHEVSETQLIWREVGSWKRVVASKV